MPRLEFFFDCSSPWTYLAFESLQTMLARTPADVWYRPFLVGGVFNAVNPSVYENRERPVPAKARYYQKDLQDWARYVGIVIGSPPVFPVNSVRVMRGAFVAEEAGCLVAYARAFFRAYWQELADISQPAVIAPIVASLGLEPQAFFTAIEQRNERPVAGEHRRTHRAGGFGSPTVFVDGNDMYFGNDRLPLVEARIRTT